MVLTLIGIRFWFDPERARAVFGLRGASGLADLHKVVALRDIWLGVLAVAFAWSREWRALALWLGLGAMVCVADAGIVIAAGGSARAVAFHLASGALCALLTVLSWRRHRRAPRD